FDVTKSILAHATLLLNVLLLPVYGHIKINLIDNLKHIFISVIVMFVIGFYGNILCTVMGSKEYAYNINSMFLIHSPFDGVPFLKYPFISLVALLFYFVVLNICELFVYKKEERWYNRISFRGNK
ncbi:MAG: hypothetical protein J6R47_03085, partial [Acholeplasmatales bacterium]|nr:hypothetical protein [Acholeplasmatales bacterium]